MHRTCNWLRAPANLHCDVTIGSSTINIWCSSRSFKGDLLCVFTMLELYNKREVFNKKTRYLPQIFTPASLKHLHGVLMSNPVPAHGIHIYVITVLIIILRYICYTYISHFVVYMLPTPTMFYRMNIYDFVASNIRKIMPFQLNVRLNLSRPSYFVLMRGMSSPRNYNHLKHPDLCCQIWYRGGLLQGSVDWSGSGCDNNPQVLAST